MQYPPDRKRRMSFTRNEKNIILDLGEEIEAKLKQISEQVKARTDDFRSREGPKTGKAEKDLRRLSPKEIKTKIVTLQKIYAEITNLQVSIKTEMEAADREVLRRGFVFK